MYQRQIVFPDHSFFLFGPRGVGKTTWLRQALPNALWKNLLLDQDYLPLLSDLSLLRAAVDALPAKSWVVIDEVQRLPAILNEVHDLISRHGERIQFAISGSSARKLRRMNVNLLAGRAIERRMFPLTAAELSADFSLFRALSFGTLPDVVLKRDYAVDILEAYVGTYLRQEIQQEALVQDIGAFHRFLKIAGLFNAEQINISAVSRDAAVSRTTTERYFDILVDTLIGVRLPGWQPRLKVRERSNPKFYLFDPGVVRALTGRIRDPLNDLECGKLLETYLLHELRSAAWYQNSGGEFYYWRTPAGVEIDFIWARGSNALGIEVKSATRWQRADGRAITELLATGQLQKGYGVYCGDVVLEVDGLRVFPVTEFLSHLAGGELLAF